MLDSNFLPSVRSLRSSPWVLARLHQYRPGQCGEILHIRSYTHSYGQLEGINQIVLIGCFLFKAQGRCFPACVAAYYDVDTRTG